ncbi:MAG: hypothetical protein M3Q23_13160 [Actinomycetota bacterium]|nr:hypothetical protein [Actinomycetota bacterium]
MTHKTQTRGTQEVAAWPVGEHETFKYPFRYERLARREDAAKLDSFGVDDRPFDLYSIFEVGPVWVVVEFADVEGRLEPVRVEIRGRGDAHDSTAYPIRASDLRRIQLGRLIEESRREIAKEAGELGQIVNEPPIDDQYERLYSAALANPSLDPAQVGHAREAHREAVQVARFFEAARKRKRGRPPLDRSELEETVDRYREAYGNTSRPTKAVADELHLAHSTVAKRIQKARELGLLPPTRRGVAMA